MYTLHIARAIKKVYVNEIRYFIFEKYYGQIRFFKENIFYPMKHLKRKNLLLLANKITEKIPDTCNAKQHYQSFIRRENRKSVKQSKLIFY